MIRVTNPRLDSVETLRWAHFRGVTVLFDNSDAGLACDGLEFYERLATFVERYFADVDAFELGCLPRSSYHVTLLDLVNDGNLLQVDSGHREIARKFGAQASVEYRPRLLLGYFANPDTAERAQRELDGSSVAAGELLMGRRLRFTSASVYGFTALDDFVRLA